MRINKIIRWAICLCCMACWGMALFLTEVTEAATKGKILFVPIDNRPISDRYGVDTLEKAGFTVLVPPDELLGGPGHMKGDSDKVWNWLEAALQEQGHVDALVCSSDTMIYGSLVSSRTHELSLKVLQNRVAKFQALRDKHPNMKIYAFSSIMRTPHYSAVFGGTEAPYMDTYAYQFFMYSSLLDKQETLGLTKQEEKVLAAVKAEIPADIMTAWQNRRDANLSVNKAMLDLYQKGVFNYFVIGHDDNAPLSQTHRESRYLAEYAQMMDQSSYQSMAGIDEIGMLLLARASTDIDYTKPFIYADYNAGAGVAMVPSFGSQPIGRTMADYIRCAGGFHTKSLKRADIALLVNTTEDGKDSFAGAATNGFQPGQQDKRMVSKVEDMLQQGVQVGLVDIATYNGSDNGLMQLMADKDLLFKLTVYGGWNTASNSLGFAMGQAVYMPYISAQDRYDLLMTRYLDEWAYEANVRQQLGTYMAQLDPKTVPDKDGAINAEGTRLLREFAAQHLQAYPNKRSFSMVLPWKRAFENQVIFQD